MNTTPEGNRSLSLSQPLELRHNPLIKLDSCHPIVATTCFFGIEGNPKSPVYREIEQVMLPPFKCSFGIHRTRIQAVNARSTFSTL
jgi:hypothetical protein